MSPLPARLKYVRLIWREFKRALREMDGLRVLMWEFLAAQGIRLPYPQRAPVEEVEPAAEVQPAAEAQSENESNRFRHLEV